MFTMISIKLKEERSTDGSCEILNKISFLFPLSNNMNVVFECLSIMSPLTARKDHFSFSLLIKVIILTIIKFTKFPFSFDII